VLKEMQGNVELLFLKGNTPACRFCDVIEQLLKELEELSDGKLKVKIEETTPEEAKEKYGVGAIPVIEIRGNNKGKMRFYGIPSGHEFAAFLASIVEASKDKTEEIPEELIKDVEENFPPLHIKVFVTPSCPYCPMMARLAHALAMASPKVTGEVWEAEEHYEEANKYNVMAVPTTVVNEKAILKGAMPPDVFLHKLKHDLGIEHGH